MSRATIVICSKNDRERIIKLARMVPFRTRVTFTEAKRSIRQNSKMWAMLTEVSYQVEWYGERLPPQDWKALFLDALKREARTVPRMDGRGYIELRGTSELTTDEMNAMIELIYEFGARHFIKFKDDRSWSNERS